MGIFTSRRELEKLKTMLAAKEKSLEEVQTYAKAISMSDPILAKIFNWQDINKESETLQRPYSQLAAVHSCIKWKARNFAQVPFRIYSGEREVTSGTMYDLMQDINPYMDHFQFWEGVSTGLDITGNSFIILDEQFTRGVPAYMWLFDPRNVEPAFSNEGAFSGWWLKRGKREREYIPPERVIQVKYYNPNNEIMGLSPLEVLRTTNETLWNAGQYNKYFFKNDATPNVVYTNQTNVSQRQRAELEKQMIEDRKGVSKSSQAQLLTGGWDAKLIGLSQKDMQFLELSKASLQDIAMVYGVPKKILGLYEDINMATAKSAELQFWEDTIMPVARMTEIAINKRLLNPAGYRGKFDFSVIDVLNERVLEKVDAVQKLLATGQFTRNELNAKFRLGFEDATWGDDPVTFSFPMEEADKAAPVLPMTVPEVETMSITKDMLAKKWNADMRRIAPAMSAAAKAVRNYFHKAEQTIIKSLLEKKAGEYTVKVALEDVPFDDISKAFSDEALYTALQPYLEEAMERGILTIVRTQFRMDNAEALALLAEKRIKVIEMNENARNEIEENLRSIISDGLADGVPTQELSRMIIEGVTGTMNNIQKRAATIARTEVNGSFSQARALAIQDDPPKYIRWISSRDAKVRDMHQHLDGKTAKYGSTFGNGLKFPLDPNGSAGEVINCRCTWEPVYEEIR